jgi:hypothetical protein
LFLGFLFTAWSRTVNEYDPITGQFGTGVGTLRTV